MKLKKYTLFSCILLITGIAYSQTPPVIEWQKSLGGLSMDYPGEILTVDDGFLIAGLTSSSDGDVSFNHGAHDAWLVKLDFAGNIAWEKTYGSTGSDGFYSISLTNDGNLLATGYSGANDNDVTGFHGALDSWVVKLDSDGNILWQKSLGGTNYEIAFDAVALSDGSYLVTGYTGSSNGDVVSTLHGAYDFWVVKLDGSGNLIWEKCFGGTKTDWPSAAIEAKDGNYIIAGYTLSNDGDVTSRKGASDGWVIKVSTAGDLIWEQSVGKKGGEDLTGICETQAGALVMSGHSSSDVPGNNGVSDFMVSRLKYNGEIKWANYFGGSDSDNGRDLLQDNDGGFVSIGSTLSPNTGDVSGKHETTDVWIMKVDPVGNFQWQKCLGGSASDVGFGIAKTADEGYIIAGFSYSNDGDLTMNHGGQDIWVVKLSAEGLRFSQSSLNPEAILVYPNPGADMITISYPEKGYMKITDQSGKTIMEGLFDGSEKINTASWYTGIYHITLFIENRSIYSTFVKTK